jgi:hypothetical protein
MFLFLRREWRKHRQITKKIQARDAEEPIHEWEKRDSQQAQILHLTQNMLRRIMDPLIAAQIYNHRFCPLISKLPEELLLCIIDFLCDDIVTLHCLQIVSRVFLRLLHDQSAVWKWEWYASGLSGSVHCQASYLRDPAKLQFQRLLQRDGRCDNCRRWNDTHEGCSWDLRVRPSYYHSSSQQYDLGQHGTVQLCDHIQITWVSIQTHIDNWRQRHPGGDWQACFDSFNVECHDASHDTRCTTREAPTWPRALLDYSDSCKTSVVFYLRWTPHCRIDTLALTADGRIPAPELRTLFQRLRSIGPVGSLCPPSRPDVLPEMACFTPLTHMGRFVYYKTGEDDKTESLSAPFPPLLSAPWHLF